MAVRYNFGHGAYTLRLLGLSSRAASASIAIVCKSLRMDFSSCLSLSFSNAVFSLFFRLGAMSMNLVDVNSRYSTEDKCREQLKRLRWPEGVTCPRCKSKTISRLFTESKFECSDCRYQFSVTVGTVFHDSHLPLTQWFLAALL